MELDRRTWCISLPWLRARRRRSGACAAAPISTRPDLEPRGTAGGLTMEGLGLLQEPLEPAPGEADFLELLDLTPPIRLRVVRELRALDEREDNRVLKTREDGADALEREGIAAEDKVLLWERHAGHRAGVRVGGESLSGVDGLVGEGVKLVAGEERRLDVTL